MESDEKIGQSEEHSGVCVPEQPIVAEKCFGANGHEELPHSPRTRKDKKGILEGPDALARLAVLEKHGRYKDSIIEDARLKLEANP
jgi:hypothetical protein